MGVFCSSPTRTSRGGVISCIAVVLLIFGSFLLTAVNPDTVEGSPDVVINSEWSDYTITVGPIKDRRGHRVEDATVRLFENGVSIGKNETGDDGLVKFVVSLESHPNNHVFKVEISHVYLDVTDHVHFSGNSTGEITIDMYVDADGNHTVDVGPVVNTIGEFVRGGLVILYHGGSHVGYTETCDSGIYSITNVSVDPEGTIFSYEITTDGYRTKSGEFVGNSSGDIVLHREKEEYEITVGPVVDQNGDPVEGAYVELNMSGFYKGYKVTHPDGEVSFFVELEFDPINYVSNATISHKYMNESEHVTFSGNSTGEITVELDYENPELYTITVGPVKDLDGDPVEGAVVRLSKGEIIVGKNETGSDGVVEFVLSLEAHPRNYVFTARISHFNLVGYEYITFSGNSSGEKTIDIYSDELAEYPVTIGPVKNRLDELLDDAFVELYNKDFYIGVDETNEYGMATINTTVDPDGKEFSYIVSKTGYERNEGTFVGNSSGEIMMTGKNEDYTITVGPVVDQYGDPVEGAQVEFKVKKEGYNKYHADSDADSSFIIEEGEKGVKETGPDGLVEFTVNLEFNLYSYIFSVIIEHDSFHHTKFYDFKGTDTRPIQVQVVEDEVGYWDMLTPWVWALIGGMVFGVVVVYFLNEKGYIEKEELEKR